MPRPRTAHPALMGLLPALGAILGAPFGVAPVGLLCGFIASPLIGRRPLDLGFAIANKLNSAGGSLLELRRVGAHALIVSGLDRAQQQFYFTIEVSMQEAPEARDDELYDAFVERFSAFERQSELSLHA
ncbi:MAG TPA: hypothetical protein VH877_28360 [Polyangia bacterium]|jgi:hypothetical protein|nr:hypothetical protein [Polyangia bacterium]